MKDLAMLNILFDAFLFKALSNKKRVKKGLRHRRKTK